MKTYKIFRRQASILGLAEPNGNGRRKRWHVVAEQVGTSRTDALRRFFGPRDWGALNAPSNGWVNEDGDVFIPNRADCVPDWNGVPTLAWEQGTVNFDHYNITGTFVPGSF
jgi:hypothetical protein